MFDSLFSLVTDVSAYHIILNIAAAALLGIFVAFIYRATVKNGLPSISLTHTLIILAMVTAMVMMAIGDSIARAFSLVGALSIIRFRTVVKDNRDTAFVFFALAAGIACGVSSTHLALIGTLTIGLLILIIFRTGLGQNGGRDFLLKIRAQPDDSEHPVYQSTFDSYLASHSLLHVRSFQLGNILELTFQVKLRRKESNKALVSELSTLEGVERVTLISSEEDETP
ncbi:MAG TPA: DUF4956 domain-containing protein [Thermoanaerobaculia bacterium]|nr:DUF4956 domain-containing protein [Thermoanaerobaculia bacterium]HUM29752.1 DUF4956 domain-containing protein [Thermoanaerobaculia bacterium]HXK67052.1 DUF4956 domain-containing protein [Thermoanaerobaculia bacterium]